MIHSQLKQKIKLLEKFSLKTSKFFERLKPKFKSFRFMLMRHWTLYDSMYYSNYLAPRLGIWNESGRKELHRFIALMGIPLDEAQQKYKYMSV